MKDSPRKYTLLQHLQELWIEDILEMSDEEIEEDGKRLGLDQDVESRYSELFQRIDSESRRNPTISLPDVLSNQQDESREMAEASGVNHLVIHNDSYVLSPSRRFPGLLVVDGLWAHRLENQWSESLTVPGQYAVGIEGCAEMIPLDCFEDLRSYSNKPIKLAATTLEKVVLPPDSPSVIFRSNTKDGLIREFLCSKKGQVYIFSEIT